MQVDSSSRGLVSWHPNGTALCTRDAAAGFALDHRVAQRPAELMGDLNADGVIATAWQLDDVPAVLHLAQTGAPVVGVG